MVRGMNPPGLVLIAVAIPLAIKLKLDDLTRQAAGYTWNTTADSTKAAYEKD